MNAIYARGINGEFALADGSLPWKNSVQLQSEAKADMNHFRQLTSGGAVIMGFNTFKTFHQPLKDRMNIVIQQKAEGGSLDGQKFSFFPSIEAAVQALYSAGFSAKSIFLIGGAKLFSQAFAQKLVDGIIYETVFRAAFPHSSIFIKAPDISLWKLEQSEEAGLLTFNQYKSREAPEAQARTVRQNPGPSTH